MEQLRGVHIALVSTVPFFLVSQLSAHIKYLMSLGMKVTVITSPGEELKLLTPNIDLSVITMDIPRKQYPWRDMKALIGLYFVFRRSTFSIVHSTTPKAGLLCAIAGKLARIPIRLHTFTGQVWLTRQGLMRFILRLSDRLIVRFATHCYTDSPSQRQLLVDGGIATSDQVSVCGKGSLAGVDLQRFSADRWRDGEKNEIRNQAGIASDAFVVTFIGRITKDKGLYECLEAFKILKKKCATVELLFIGPVDDASGEDIIRKVQDIPHAHYLGYFSEPESYLAITDVLCLPSYREGFGTVVIEAAAMGVPCVGTKISGLMDAVEDGVTGLLVPVQNITALHQALERLVNDRQLLSKLGIQARKRCEREFASTVVSEMVAKEYIKRL